MILQNEDFFFFLISGHLMGHPLTELSHLSNLLQVPEDCRMADVEFFCNISCSCKIISFHDPLNWLLSNSGSWPLCSSSSRLSSPLQNFLNHHCTVRFFISSSWAKCVVNIASCLCCFMTHFELKFAFCLTSFP